MLIDTGFSYYGTEKSFVDYFDRLRDTGKTFDEIENLLPQLEDYYCKMVVVPKYRKPEPTLENLFTNWKRSITHLC